MPSFTYRSNEPEILDDFELDEHDLTTNLKELESVNKLLGGYSILKEGLQWFLTNHKEKGIISIVDVGCGGGDNLRFLANYARSENIKAKFLGIDASEGAISYARNHSTMFPEISFLRMNVFDPEFEELNADLVLFNLVLHHFRDEQIVKLLTICRNKGAALVISDLQRSWWAYQLFRIASRVLGFSYIGRHDGKLSILKGFRKNEWVRLLTSTLINEYYINWRWAFRFLVLIAAPKTPHDHH